MKFIIRKRREQKTTDLIKIAYANNSYMVVRSRDLAKDIFYKSKKMGIPILFPITYESFINQQYYYLGIKSFVIDDIDEFLQRMSRVPIIAVTGTLEEEEENNE